MYGPDAVEVVCLYVYMYSTNSDVYMYSTNSDVCMFALCPSGATPMLVFGEEVLIFQV